MIFIDTGAFLARYHGRDQYHRQAVAAWGRLDHEKAICLTSNLVLSEMFTLLARRMGYAFAAQRAHAIFYSERLTVIRSTHEEEIEALKFFEKYADQHVSFADCVSFTLMHQRRIHQVFSFDHHFVLAGFQIWP